MEEFGPGIPPLPNDGLSQLYTIVQAGRGKQFQIALHDGHLVGWAATRVPSLAGQEYAMHGRVGDDIGHAMYTWAVGGNPMVLGDSGEP